MWNSVNRRCRGAIYPWALLGVKLDPDVTDSGVQDDLVGTRGAFTSGVVWSTMWVGVVGLIALEHLLELIHDADLM